MAIEDDIVIFRVEGDLKPLKKSARQYAARFGGERFADDSVGDGLKDCHEVLRDTSVPVSDAANELRTKLATARRKYQQRKSTTHEIPTDFGESDPRCCYYDSSFTAIEKRDYVNKVRAEFIDVSRTVLGRTPGRGQRFLNESDHDIVIEVYGLDQHGMEYHRDGGPNLPADRETRRKRVYRAKKAFAELVRREISDRLQTTEGDRRELLRALRRVIDSGGVEDLMSSIPVC